MDDRLNGVSATMAALAARDDARALVARATAWRHAFLAAPGTRWALFVDSPAEFAAALFGAWHAGKHVLLPGDARPDTLAALREHVDGMAGDLPQGLQPSATESPLQWPAWTRAKPGSRCSRPAPPVRRRQRPSGWRS